ncbi:MAG: SPASM domain-containing protein [Chloroflexi bacterium]|nr:SPASM domain-containing protein [Chloroflexota bacterium]
MKESRYNIFVEGDDSVYAVNLLSRTALNLSHDAYQTYLDLARLDLDDSTDLELQRFKKTLQDALFLLEDDFDELGYIRYRSHQERFNTRDLGLVITPTLGCNFDCHYCFEDKTDTDLNRNAQNRLAQLVATNIVGRESLSVQWFGGEPLKALDVIENLSRQLIPIASAAGAGYAATLISNGYLMTRDVSVLLNELQVKEVQITLDGDRYLHDRTRYIRPGKGSFDVILENIKDASDLLSVKVRVHVAPYNIESVRALIETLANEGMAEHITELYFAPLFNYRANRPDQQAYAVDGKRFMDSESFSRMQIDLLNRAYELGFSPADFLGASYGICTAVRENTLVIDPHGNVMKCYKDVGVGSEAIGTLKDGLTPAKNLLKWMDVPIPRDDECRECRVLPVCLGGCSKQWQEGASKSVICTPLKFNIDERIRMYFEHEGWETAPRKRTPEACKTYSNRKQSF